MTPEEPETLRLDRGPPREPNILAGAEDLGVSVVASGRARSRHRPLALVGGITLVLIGLTAAALGDGADPRSGQSAAAGGGTGGPLRPSASRMSRPPGAVPGTPGGPAGIGVRPPVVAGVRYQAREFAGTVRRWRLYVPMAARLGPVPLVVLFHQAGGDPDTIVAETSMDLLAEQDGFMTAVPLGLGGGAQSTWDAGRCCGYARDTQVDDVGFVKELLDLLVTTEPIDQGQLYAAGASNGGMLAYDLACRLADRFQAVFSVAGSQTVDDCRPSRPVTVVEFHSLTDTLVPYFGGVDPQFSQPLTAFTPIPAVFAGWFARNGCQTESARGLGPDEEVVVGSGCADSTLIEVWLRLAGGGHEWPRTPEAPVDASDVIAEAVTSRSLVRHPGMTSRDPLIPCDPACPQPTAARRPFLLPLP